MQEIKIEELAALPGKKRIIDIRNRDSFDRGSYPGAGGNGIENERQLFNCQNMGKPV